MADGNVKDGRAWRIGTDADVAWISDGTSAGRTITAAIPPVSWAPSCVTPVSGRGRWHSAKTPLRRGTRPCERVRYRAGIVGGPDRGAQWAW